MRTFQQFHFAALLVAASLLTLGLTGCGSSAPTTYPLAGKVVADGKPVTGGTLTFAPVTTGPTAASGPVLAVVKEDGTFAVASGAVNGKQAVTFSGPSGPPQAPWDGKGAPPPAPKGPYDGYRLKTPEIEVQAGKNDLTIELVK